MYKVDGLCLVASTRNSFIVLTDKLFFLSRTKSRKLLLMVILRSVWKLSESVKVSMFEQSVQDWICLKNLLKLLVGWFLKFRLLFYYTQFFSSTCFLLKDIKIQEFCFEQEEEFFKDCIKVPLYMCMTTTLLNRVQIKFYQVYYWF
jgi:hypothetical protein